MIDNHSNMIISSRVRLARNAKSFPFVDKLKEDEQEKIVEMAKNAIFNNSSLNKTVNFLDMNEMEPLDRQNLIEKHLISPKFASDDRKRGVIIDTKEKISIMINEEDHIRIQCIEDGFNLLSCFDVANKLDDLLEEQIEFGFDEQFGYLTHCPTNVGTGMRASVMAHIPMIVASSLFEKLMTSLSQLGMTIRGIYGEGSKSSGNIFQISNQVTLGTSEMETIEKLNQVVNEIIDQERKAEIIFYKENKVKVTDTVMRAIGVLKYAESLSNEEFLLLVSKVKLGINLEIIKDITHEKINKLQKDVLPSEIMKKGGVLNSDERDVTRAKIVKASLNE